MQLAYTTLLWQKETSNIPSDELLICILASVLFFKAKFYASNSSSHPAAKTPWYSIDVSGNDS